MEYNQRGKETEGENTSLGIIKLKGE